MTRWLVAVMALCLCAGSWAGSDTPVASTKRPNPKPAVEKRPHQMVNDAMAKQLKALVNPKLPVLKLTDADNAKMVKAAVGQMVEITLKSNATTGYTWRVVSGGNEVLNQIGDDHYTAPGAPIPGKGGTQTFKYVVRKAGSASVKLEYVRPWEAEKPVQTWSVTFAVAGSGRQPAKR